MNYWTVLWGSVKFYPWARTGIDILRALGMNGYHSRSRVQDYLALCSIPSDPSHLGYIVPNKTICKSMVDIGGLVICVCCCYVTLFLCLTWFVSIIMFCRFHFYLWFLSSLSIVYLSFVLLLSCVFCFIVCFLSVESVFLILSCESSFSVDLTSCALSITMFSSSYSFSSSSSLQLSIPLRHLQYIDVLLEIIHNYHI